MYKSISLIAGLTALFAVGAAGATSGDPCGDLKASDTNPDTGNFFEVYQVAGIHWTVARVCAAKNHPTLAGVKGYLATITSSKEDVWVDNLRRKTYLREVWVGGSQIAGSEEPGSGWFWENGEGSIATPQQPSPSYSNWLVIDVDEPLEGEPNDLGGPENPENHLAIGLGGSFGWNDEGNLNNITGYVVEYDIPRTAECTVGLDCETIKGQTLVFPEGSFEPDGGQTIGFTAFEFTDPRVDPMTGKCTTGELPLELFKEEDGFPADSQLTIPAYLCGSPRFLVVKVDATDLTIENGAVEVVNDTQVVLPGNLFECSGPIDDDAQLDPQKQDVVVWQSTNPAEMLETSLSTGVFAGAATEATNGCGSTRAKVRTGSYFVVGMHIDFGDDFDYRDFVGLTLEKLKLLRESVSRARSAGVLKNGDATKMTAQLNNAVRKLERDDPSGAFKHVNLFLKFVAAARYNSELLPPDTKPYNYNGDHLMRGENIAFTLQDKVIPYAP
jgi:hypothetical protein